MYVGLIRPHIGSIQGTPTILPSDCLVVSVAGGRKRRRFICANCISIFSRSRRDVTSASILVISRATSRAVSWIEREVGIFAEQRAQVRGRRSWVCWRDKPVLSHRSRECRSRSAPCRLGRCKCRAVERRRSLRASPVGRGPIYRTPECAARSPARLPTNPASRLTRRRRRPQGVRKRAQGVLRRALFLEKVECPVPRPRGRAAAITAVVGCGPLCLHSITTAT